MISLPTVADIITDIFIYSILGLSLYAITKRKSTRKLFSVTLWATWLTVAGLLFLPAEYNRVMRGTMIGMMTLLFLTSQEYRSNQHGEPPTQ